MVVDFVVQESGKLRITIRKGDEKVADIRLRKDFTYGLTASNGNEWTLSARFGGEIRPFSMAVSQSKAHDAHDVTSGTTVLVIKDHLFLHNEKFYLLGGTPEGRPPKEVLVGRRYICRLDNFPFSELSDVDYETRSKLISKFRGAPVGELDGLGKEGHHLRFFNELEDIGLPLAASCYLLYSTA